MARLNPTNFGYQNFYSGLLTADITSGTLTISLDTVPTPTSGILVIDPDSSTSREVILYTSKGASTITCPSDGRGFSGTTATSHLTGTTVIMAPIDRWFTGMASGELSTDPLRTEMFFDFVASGLVWTADAAGSTRNASMTSGVIYINGRRLTLTAVTAHSFTASKDTYIDISDNGDGTGLITYTEVTNNNPSPALATNNVRIGIIVTGATNIATAASVNQGQESRVLPIASSIAYAVTDSLGNLICPRDPERRILGYRQSITTQNIGTGDNQITGLTCPIVVPTGRKVKISGHIGDARPATAFDFFEVSIWDGTVSSGTKLSTSVTQPNTSGTTSMSPYVEAVNTPSAAAKTFNLGGQSGGAGGNTTQFTVGASSPNFIKVELI